MAIVALFLAPLIVLMVGLLPIWPPSRQRGRGPSRGIGAVSVITPAAWPLDRM